MNIRYFQLYIHDIYTSFDCSPPLHLRGIFLDISKSSDRVWHDGLIYKVKCIGINGMFLKLITSFLENVVKLGNRCALKLEKATKALFTGFF